VGTSLGGPRSIRAGQQIRAKLRTRPRDYGGAVARKKNPVPKDEYPDDGGEGGAGGVEISAEERKYENDGRCEDKMDGRRNVHCRSVKNY